MALDVQSMSRREEYKYQKLVDFLLNEDDITDSTEKPRVFTKRMYQSSDGQYILSEYKICKHYPIM